MQLVAVDVGEANASNLAITEVGVQPLIYQQKYTDHLTARITNFGDKAAAHVGVEFLIDEHLVEKREIQVAARESQVVEFSGFNLSEGINPCVIQISGDIMASQSLSDDPPGDGREGSAGSIQRPRRRKLPRP